MAKIADVQEVSLEKLRPYERNAKKHGAGQVEKLKASIMEFGFLTPCLIDSDYNLIAGHGRVMAAKELGIEKVPCVFIEGLTDEQRRAYILADNRLGELGEWDMDIVFDELTELNDLGFDVELTGFDMPEESPEVIEDDFDESAIPDEPRTKMGDLWQLGEHRLICGDSTDVNVIDRLMDGVKADMVFTDPPYGISVVGSSGNIGGDTKFAKAGGYKKVIGDDEDFEPSFILKTFEQSKIMLWGANYFSSKLPDSGKWLVWDKNRGEGTTFSDCELCWTNLDGIAVKKYKCTWDGMRREGESGKRFHPTQKPIKLCSDIIRDYSEEGDIIADLFGGSGSTLIACEQLNRKCYMCELDEHYCDVIINRWETLTGREAVLING